MSRWRTKSIGAVALLAFVVAGCQDRHSLTDDGGLSGQLPPREKAVAQKDTLTAANKVPAGGKNGGQPKRDTASAVEPVAAWQRVDASEPAATQDGIPERLGLNEAIETGLSRNPDLVALRQAEGVNEALVGVARTYPFNPTVQTRILPYAREADHTLPVYNYVLLWQQFELAHQRRFRAQNAAATLSATRWNIQQAELTNTAVTAQLYFGALYQSGLRELADLTAKLNNELLDVMEKRLKAGKAAAADVAMVRIDTRTSRQQALLAEVNFKNSLLALRRQLNLPPDAPLELTGDLATFNWHSMSELGQLMGKDSELAKSLDCNGLVNELAARRPDVLAARASADAGQANVRLARAARVPNLWFGPFYSRDSESIVNIGFQAQMDIPVVNTGKPLVRQREAELHQQLTTREQLEAKARVEARTALDRYEQARALCDLARGESSQKLPQELQKLEEQFEKGEIDILRIFQARNSLLLYRKTFLDSLNELAVAATVLSAAGGVPPAALISQPGSTQVEELQAQPRRLERRQPTHSAVILLTPLTKVP